MSLVNLRAFCVLMGEDCYLFGCHGAALPITKKSSHGTEYPEGGALAEISTTPYPSS